MSKPTTPTTIKYRGRIYKRAAAPVTQADIRDGLYLGLYRVINEFTVEAPGGTAYKGYLIRVHPVSKDVWIEKGGHHVSYAKSVDDAKRIIDHDLT